MLNIQKKSINTNEKQILANINKVYAYNFFHNLVFAYVIERLFNLERGLSVQQMVYIEIVYAVTCMIAEIPTGLFADILGRKFSIVFSAVLYIFYFSIQIFAYNFWSFAIATVCVGIAGALVSGALNSLVYESLKVNQIENDMEKIIGKIEFYGTLSASVAALSGGYIAGKYGNVSVYYLSVISMVISTLIALSLTETKHIKSEEEVEKFSIKDIINFFLKNRNIRGITLYYIIFGSFIAYIYEYYQIYLNEIKFPVEFFGIVLVCSMLSQGTSQLLSYKIKKSVNNNLLFFICIFTAGLSVIAISFISNFIGIVFLIGTFFLYGAIEPLIWGNLHNSIESSFRATIESSVSFMLNLFSILIGLIFGYITTNYSIFSGLFFIGISLLLYSIYYLLEINIIRKAKN